MMFLLQLFALLSMLLAAKGGDDDEDESDDDDEEEDEDESDDEESDEEDDEDEDDDADTMTLEEALAAKKAADREAARLRRAIKAGKRPKRKPADPAIATENREKRVAVRELLVDSGLPTAAARLVDLAQLELDDDGELVEPDDVLEWVKGELEDLGVKIGKSDDDDDKPTTKRRGKRKVVKDKGGGKADGSSDSVEARLIAQAGLGDVIG